MADVLHLNPTACDGFGYCAEIVPELIGRDEWGFPILRREPIPVELLSAVQRATRTCPRRALKLVRAAEDRRPRSTDTETLSVTISPEACIVERRSA